MHGATTRFKVKATFKPLHLFLRVGNFSGIWRCLVGFVVSGVSKDRNIFREVRKVWQLRRMNELTSRIS